MMSMKFEKWWWPVQCYTLSNGLKFAGLVRLGYLYSVSVWCLWKYFGEWEILLQQSQQFLITSFIREIMEAVYFIFCWHFMWWMLMQTHISVSEGEVGSCRNFLCFLSFLFLSKLYWAPKTVEVWSGIENGKKKSSVQGHISHIVLFFFYCFFLYQSCFGYSQ